MSDSWRAPRTPADHRRIETIVSKLTNKSNHRWVISDPACWRKPVRTACPLIGGSVPRRPGNGGTETDLCVGFACQYAIIRAPATSTASNHDDRHFPPSQAQHTIARPRHGGRPSRALRAVAPPCRRRICNRTTDDDLIIFK